jgi:hypothetical protein
MLAQANIPESFICDCLVQFKKNRNTVEEVTSKPRSLKINQSRPSLRGRGLFIPETCHLFGSCNVEGIMRWPEFSAHKCQDTGVPVNLIRRKPSGFKSRRRHAAYPNTPFPVKDSVELEKNQGGLTENHSYHERVFAIRADARCCLQGWTSLLKSSHLVK